jgi:hypothetical protein
LRLDGARFNHPCRELRVFPRRTAFVCVYPRRLNQWCQY